MLCLTSADLERNEAVWHEAAGVKGKAAVKKEPVRTAVQRLVGIEILNIRRQLRYVGCWNVRWI